MILYYTLPPIPRLSTFTSIGCSIVWPQRSCIQDTCGSPKIVIRGIDIYIVHPFHFQLILFLQATYPGSLVHIMSQKESLYFVAAHQGSAHIPNSTIYLWLRSQFKLRRRSYMQRANVNRPFGILIADISHFIQKLKKNIFLLNSIFL